MPDIVEAYLKRLGRRIRRLRKDRGLTQAALAERAEFDATYIAKIERGDRIPSLETVARLASALDVSPSFLMTALDNRDEDHEDDLMNEVLEMVRQCDTKQLRFMRDFLWQLKGYDTRG